MSDPPGYAAAKRGFDLVLAVTLLIATAPLWIVIAVIIKLTSPGPVLYRQRRVGRGGRYFTCLKFRSMVVDAHAQRDLLRHRNEANGPVFKIRLDPRVTPVGRVMRKFSIDELPQLLNVLSGAMSIVGPRPPLPEEVSSYDAHQQHRLSVKPGLTCLWQISGRSYIGFDEWVELDLQYIRDRTFWTDMVITVKTIPAVILAKGAH
jgi:lipopolysaccharide/colanic/teichoic acid biosynthesis glycosyltransferase